jgi:hypothetical protein
MTAFWHTLPHSLLEVERCFISAHCLQKVVIFFILAAVRTGNLSVQNDDEFNKIININV